MPAEPFARRCPALLTDLYELTMAYAYWKTGTHTKESVFQLFFRKNPFKGGYTIACGLADVIDYVTRLEFTDDDFAYLASLEGNDRRPLFDPAFLAHLRHLDWPIDIDAMPEGTVAFPHEPLLRVRGPILQCQILETALLTLINFQSLIATKAARVCSAAQGDPVIEFGLRRAQGTDGGLAATRAAYVGGCMGTSNVLAGKLFDIPVRGTHAHSWIMSFDTEAEAFAAYADAMPNNCIFLVDTYNTLDGVRRAVETAKTLRARGHEMVGIRLDSGDLARLSIEARKILDAAGFPDAVILASNDLDEYAIASLKDQGAPIRAWGVGTHLVTAHDDPALGGIYKLAAVRRPGMAWDYKIKLSDQSEKVTIPGVQQVRRFESGGENVGDLIYDPELPVKNDRLLIDPVDPTRHKRIPAAATHTDLLVPVFRAGRLVYEMPSIHATRARAAGQLATFHPGIKRFLNPDRYAVGLDPGLSDLKTRLLLKARGSCSGLEAPAR